MEPEQVAFDELEASAHAAAERARLLNRNVKETFAAIANAALAALSRKAMYLYSLTLVAGAFAWVLAVPDYLRLCAATIFSLVLIFAGTFKRGKDD